MLYRFLRKKIKKLIAPAYPHIRILKYAKEKGGKGTGRYQAVGRKPFSKNLRYAYGETLRDAYLNYMNEYYRLTPKDQIHARK